MRETDRQTEIERDRQKHCEFRIKTKKSNTVLKNIIKIYLTLPIST